MQKHFLGCLVATTCLSTANVFAQCDLQLKTGGGLPGFDDFVQAAYSDDPDGGGPTAPVLYAGGKFAIAGNVFANRIAKWNGTAWSPVGGGLPHLTWVQSITRFNKLLVASGWGSTAPRTLYWDGISWNPMSNGLSGTNDWFQDLIVFNGELIGAGSGVFKWDGATWTTLGGGVGGTVYSMCVCRGKLYIGGTLFSAGGQVAYKLAYWDGSTWFTPNYGIDGIVKALLEVGGDLIMAGGFDHVGGQGTPGIARFDGTAWYPMGSGIPDGAECLAHHAGTLFVGGNFTLPGPVPARGVAKWNGVDWEAIASGAYWLNSMTSHENELVLGGSFSNNLDSPAKYLATWNRSLGVYGSSGLAFTVFEFVESPDALYCVGAFKHFDDEVVNGIVRWDDSLLKWVPIGDVPAGLALCGMPYRSGLIVGGTYFTNGSSTVRSVARWNGSELSLVGVVSSTSNANISVVAEYGGDLVIGGSFESVEGIPVANIASLNGNRWSAMAQGPGGTISSLAVHENLLVAAGSFPGYLQTWNGANWAPLAGLNNFVLHLLPHAGHLYAAGRFTDPSGTAHYVAKWNGQSWTHIGAPLLAGVAKLAIRGGRLIASTMVNNQSSTIYELIDGTWTPVFTSNNLFRAIAAHRGDIFIGGGFVTLANQVSAYWGRYGPSCASADLTCDGSVNALDVVRFTRGLRVENFTQCETLITDFTADGFTDDNDVAGFVDCVLNAACP